MCNWGHILLFWGESTGSGATLQARGRWLQLWNNLSYCKGDTCRSQFGGTQKGVGKKLGVPKLLRHQQIFNTQGEGLVKPQEQEKQQLLREADGSNRLQIENIHGQINCKNTEGDDFFFSNSFFIFILS